VSSERTSPSGADSVPLSVRAAASWSWRVLLIAAAVAAFLWLLAALKTIVVPVAIALLLTILLAPVRRTLQRWHLSKGLATAVSIVGLIVLVGGLVTLAGTSIVSGFQDLADQAVEGFRQFTTWLAEGPLKLDSDQLSQYGQQLQSSLVESSGLVSGALGAATTVGHVFVGALIALFCTIFFLLDGRTIWTWLVNLLPVRARENVHQAGRRGLVTLSAYVRTQILVAFVDAVGIGIGSAFFVPALALPIGILVFVGSFVPIIGAIAPVRSPPPSCWWRTAGSRPSSCSASCCWCSRPRATSCSRSSWATRCPCTRWRWCSWSRRAASPRGSWGPCSRCRSRPC